MSTATANGSRDTRCVVMAEASHAQPMNSRAIDDRYLKQRLVPEIGDAGQERLSRSRVLCVGAGGLGCASLPYLAGAGVGQITIIDADRVERSNLQRQVLFGESDLGHPKAEAALRRLSDLNPRIELQALEERLSTANVESLFRNHDLVLEGSDNYATKFLCGDASVKFSVPLVYASATGMEAMVTLFDAADGPCLRCLFPSPPTGWVPNCAEAGVLGPLVGMAGCIQATEAVMWLVTGRSGLKGRLWWLDARTAASRQLELKKRSECPTCGLPRERIELVHEPPAFPEIDFPRARELKQKLFVDVREIGEFEEGHLPGAIHLPLSRLARDADVSLDKAQHYVLYCQTGPRAERAAQILAGRGLRLYLLRGGIASWDGEPERCAGVRHGT